ncbi:hypothetical protein [Clostridium fungisolvens]|uniref:Uncharacterized protein n=1 Tax=Clostridium fungisolvens TaxID=1604897 RepID=A0A6V8SE31_9CLOT|nr:hypothetical protein [Clostridium fungisolvens]GFP74715.1 hypothetical protein bsdtw1_00770 [Clostridium fungisolvens]
MRKLFLGIILMLILLQSTILYLFFSDKLSLYPNNLVEITWICISLLSILFGVSFFILNKKVKLPLVTVSIVSSLGIVIFPFMLFKNWIIVLAIIILAFALHLYTYKDNKLSILPVISAIMGIYSLVLYLLMHAITSM